MRMRVCCRSVCFLRLFANKSANAISDFFFRSWNLFALRKLVYLRLHDDIAARNHLWNNEVVQDWRSNSWRNQAENVRINGVSNDSKSKKQIKSICNFRRKQFPLRFRNEFFNLKLSICGLWRWSACTAEFGMEYPYIELTCDSNGEN